MEPIIYSASASPASHWMTSEGPRPIPGLGVKFGAPRSLGRASKGSKVLRCSRSTKTSARGRRVGSRIGSVRAPPALRLRRGAGGRSRCLLAEHWRRLEFQSGARTSSWTPCLDRLWCQDARSSLPPGQSLGPSSLLSGAYAGIAAVRSPEFFPSLTCKCLGSEPRPSARQAGARPPLVSQPQWQSGVGGRWARAPELLCYAAPKLPCNAAQPLAFRAILHSESKASQPALLAAKSSEGEVVSRLLQNLAFPPCRNATAQLFIYL